MPRNNAITGEKWVRCDLCDFDYPLSQTGVNTAGLRVCFEKDWDASRYVKFFTSVSSAPVSVSGQYLTTADGTPITDADGHQIIIL